MAKGLGKDPSAPSLSTVRIMYAIRSYPWRMAIFVREYML